MIALAGSHTRRRRDSNVTREGTGGIGARIRRLREPASQLEFGRRLGISREYVSRIEGGAQPGTDVLRRVAELTGTSLDFLVYGPEGAPGVTAAGAAGPDLETALERLLVGTTLRLPPMSAGWRRRTERAWRELPEGRRNDVRALVQRTGLVAVAIEGLFPAGRPARHRPARRSPRDGPRRLHRRLRQAMAEGRSGTTVTGRR